jgi:hypothetical protein
MSFEMSQEEQGGYFQALPFYLDRACHIDRVILSTLPWGAPGIWGAVGSVTEPEKESALVVAYEWPVPWLRTTQPLGKPQIELLHLQRFRTDQALATGTLPFQDVAEGADPPDFQLRTPDAVVGLDCSAITMEDRRQAVALFMEVRRRLLEVPHPRLAHLIGFTVYLWFNQGVGLGKPFRRQDEAAADELVEALAGYKPDASKLWVGGESGLPDPAPDMGISRTESGASFYAVPFTNATPSTVLESYTGFELGLAYTTTQTASAAWAEVQRLASGHDREGVDWLLLSAGAPNRYGQLFASEELLADFITDNPQPLKKPDHIQRVLLHSWGTGRAIQLHPDLAELWGPLYQGVALPHQPLA